MLMAAYRVPVVCSSSGLLFGVKPSNKLGIHKQTVADGYLNSLPDNWFDQRVDHFNTSDTRTFKQRYFVNDKYYKTGGPVFLLVDGENEANDYFITLGACARYAEKFNALTVDLEHRYYGQSVPTEDLSVDNLQYLTVEQALKDIEQFVGYMNRKLSLNTKNTKWIAFGGSYAGNLVAWLREKYPQAVAGSVASSAPVEARYDFKEYFGGVSHVLGADCTNQISEAVHQLDDQLKTTPPEEGWHTIDKLFNLCTPLMGTDLNTVHSLKLSLIITFGVAAQYNSRPGTLGIDQACSLMMTTTNDTGVVGSTTPTTTPLKRLATVQSKYNSIHLDNCVDYDYNKSINDLKQTSKTATKVKSGVRQWFYQACTQLGFFVTTDLADSPFGNQSVPIDYYQKWCAAIYGPYITGEFIQTRVNRTNANYGGLNPGSDLTNVVFVNGAVDPYHVLSIVNDLNNNNQSIRAILMNSTSHGTDMLGPLASDSQELIDGRLAIEKQIQFISTCISDENTRLLVIGDQPMLPKYNSMFQLPIADKYVNTLPDNWFDQRVDHFNTSDTRTYKQRYFINNKFYKTGGPVFLMLDGEAEGTDYFATAGAMARYAQRFGALAVELEHRFYGQSIPTEDLSVDNLRYLTVEQALKDTDEFIRYLNGKLSLNSTSKWIVFGGSYSGSLAAWFREKYPHSVAGSVASSAPVDALYEFKDYFGDGKLFGTDCTDQIREAVRQLYDQLKTPEGCQAISKQFNLCTPLNGTVMDSVHAMMLALVGPFGVAAQYDGRPGILGLREVCSVMTNRSTPIPLDRWAKLRKQFASGRCIDHDYNHSIDGMRNTSKTSPFVKTGDRQWFYQMCAEFGFFMTTGLEDSPFGYNSIPLEFFTKQCMDIYGKQFSPEFIQTAVNRTNRLYGGFKPDVTNVVFPNGAVDPWHLRSVLSDLNPTTRAIYMKSTSHGADMLQPFPNDPKELTDARLAIEKQLQLFLQ
ncbi:uncharacterized protein LOC128955089 [Oppia nitens]|uniref:uncharacterized protein LOC128955089 n=1 Tax=Oppia nitens TaxID=1686743 RepID=UPI0023DAA423|nr:uncharacterized protein LOC128955089 [Oppia nitens]